MRVLVAVAAMVVALGCDRAEREDYRTELDLAPLIAALGADDDGEDDAAERLVALGDAAVPALAQAIASERQPIGLAAIEALGEIDTPRADEALIGVATTHPDAETRATALLKLGGTGRPAARPVLEAALADPSPMVSHTAAYACGALCTSPGAVDRLVALGLGEVAEHELGRLRATLLALHRGPDAAAAAYARERIRTATAPILATDSPLAARTRAALLAADAGATDVEPVLVAAAGDGASPMLRLAAIQWLGKHGSAAGVPALAAALRDRSTAPAAAVALQAASTRGVPGARDAMAAVARDAAAALGGS